MLVYRLTMQGSCLESKPNNIQKLRDGTKLLELPAVSNGSREPSFELSINGPLIPERVPDSLLETGREAPTILPWSALN